MAKVVFGNGVSLVSGRIGGNVYARNRGGFYVRNYVPTPNPATAHQTARRGAFNSISSEWRGFTEAQRQNWNSYAQTQTHQDRVGRQRTPNGFEAYQRFALSADAAGISGPFPTPPPAPTFKQTLFPRFNFPMVWFDTTYFGFYLGPGAVEGDYVKLWATPPLSSGINFFTNKFRAIGRHYIDSTEILFGVVIVADQYFGYYGGSSVPSGSRVAIRAAHFTQNQAGPQRQWFGDAP